MVARGRVQNGVVILNDGVRLPEGQEVTVLVGGVTLTEPRFQDAPSHSVLDIPAVSLGPVLNVFTADDDLFGEMLDGRP
jgi:hypothetical protein